MPAKAGVLSKPRSNSRPPRHDLVYEAVSGHGGCRFSVQRRPPTAGTTLLLEEMHAKAAGGS